MALRGALLEVALPSGRVLHRSPLDPAQVRAGELVVATAYLGDAVLLTLGEGARQRVARWEPGSPSGTLVPGVPGTSRVLGAAAGTAAYGTTERACRTVLQPGGARLCRETFAGLSPDGARVLALNSVGDGLVVRDADDAHLVRRFPVPEYARGSAWESDDVVLVLTVDDEAAHTLVRRCSVASGRCRTVVRFPFVDRVPVPVPAVGLPR